MVSQGKRIIKKYPNRRLYDTATSSYITLEDVKQLVLDNIDIQIEDAKTHDDLTQSVLLQIILEEESRGAPLFTYEVLTRIIRFYGHAMQGLMGGYLEKNMQIFAQMQERLQENAKAVTKDYPMLNNAVWSEFLKFQAPAMQSMMTSYLEQTTNMFVEMQSQLQDRTRTMLGAFAMPGFGAAPPRPAEAAAAEAAQGPSHKGASGSEG